MCTPMLCIHMNAGYQQCDAYFLSHKGSGARTLLLGEHWTKCAQPTNAHTLTLYKTPIIKGACTGSNRHGQAYAGRPLSDQKLAKHTRSI
jgi:hypothetical protein